MKFLIYDFYLPYLFKDVEHSIGGVAVESLALIKGLKYYGCKIGVIAWKGAKEFIKAKTDVDIVEAFDKKKGIRKIVKYWKKDMDIWV